MPPTKIKLFLISCNLHGNTAGSLIQILLVFQFAKNFYITFARGFSASHGSIEGYLGNTLFLPNLLHQIIKRGKKDKNYKRLDIPAAHTT